jgi:hypothetical protein
MSATEATAVADGLWSIDGSVRFLGHRLPARATVVRLADGSLLVYSPVSLSHELRAEVERLGPVTAIVAPNTYHHLHFEEWADAFPEARTYAAQGLRKKRPALRIDEELGNAPPEAWRGDLEQLWFRGIPVLNEIVLLHCASRTLIVCDLAFHIHEVDGPLGSLVLRANDMWRRFGPSRTLRLLLRANRRASREGLAAIDAWDYDRVIPAHGEIVETGGREAMRRAFAFLR